MTCVVDTNVLCVANRRTPHASAQCVQQTVRALQTVSTTGHLVLDRGLLIMSEYRGCANAGQPGVGDAFLKWVLTNWANRERCTLVTITPNADRQFEEFPNNPALTGFDRDDRKFVAVALAHPELPPILNAVDTDWWEFREALETHGVRIEFLCPDAMSA